MRTTLPLLVFVSLAGSTAGCGGATETLGGGDDGGRAEGGEGGRAEGGLPGVDGGTPTDCTGLANQIAELQAKAQACCAMCDIVQCTAAVNGLCCPVSVNSATSPATQAFAAAVAQYQATCPDMCTEIMCPKAPSGVCDGTGGTGECR